MRKQVRQEKSNDADKQLAKKTVYKFGIIGFVITLSIHIGKGYINKELPLWLQSLLELTPEFIGAFCIWLLGLYIWQEIDKQDENLKNQSQLIAIKETIQNTFPVLKNSGIIEYHSKIPPIEIFEELFRNAKTKIYILQTWIEDITALAPHIINASKRNIDIKILVLASSSNQLNLRADAIPIPIEKALNRLGNTKHEIEKIANHYKNVQLRFYDDLLSLSAYIIDDTCFIGWYWRGNEETEANNRNKPYLQIFGSETELFREVNEHFKNVWQLSERSTNS